MSGEDRNEGEGEGGVEVGIDGAEERDESLLVGGGGNLVETDGADAREEAEVIGDQDKKEETGHDWEKDVGFFPSDGLDHITETFDNKFGEVL